MQKHRSSEIFQFRPDFRVEIHDSNTVFLIGEKDRFMLSGRHNATIAGMLDGQRTIQNILDTTRDSSRQSEILYTLNQLKDKGYIVATPQDGLPSNAAYWQGAGLDIHEVKTRLSTMAISVHCIGDVSPSPLTEFLVQAGLNVSDTADMQVVIVDDYLRSELTDLNAKALKNGRPWCIIKPVGMTLHIGPVFTPGSGPCWECLAHRLRNNRPVEQFVIDSRKNGAGFGLPALSTPAGLAATYGLAAHAVTLMLAGAQDAHPLHATLFSLNPATFESKRHRVVKRPQCPVCGDPGIMAEQGARPIPLAPVEKTVHREGGYRIQMPWQTYDRYAHHISPVTGVVAYLEPMKGRHSGPRAVYASGYLVCPKDGVPRTNEFDKVCSGKGATPDQAKASALCEAIERFSGIYQGDEAVVRTSMDELGNDAIHFNDLQNFSRNQFEQRNRINAQTRDRRKWIPLPFDTRAIIDWTLAWSFRHCRMRYVPLTYCYSQTPRESGTQYGTHNPNGAAAGNCTEEALLQGILELIERDAVAVWWYNQLTRPQIDPTDLHDGYFQSLKIDYSRMGWDLWVLDLTHDLGIPVYAALARHVRENRFTIGFGCHLDAQLAVQRALTEVNQLFDPTGNLQAPWDMSRLPDLEFLFPQKNTEPANAAALPCLGGRDLKADIEFCMERLSMAGLELLGVNKTRPDLGLNVVHAIAPGLRHFWPRFGPGRLYDVPHDMGWIERPHTEKELNPVPLFL